MGKIKISVIGLGGVGGYFGFKLAQSYAQSDSAEITFVAHGETYDAVKKNGLILLSPEHPVSVTRPNYLIQSIEGQPDVILICVKAYSLNEVCEGLKSKVGKNTILLPLMNGIDIYERIRKIITRGIVLPSCVYVASHIKEKGIVEHKNLPGKIIMGNDPDYPGYNPRELVDLLKGAAIDIEYKADPFPDIWIKFIFIASFGLVSARYNKSIGQVNEEPALHNRAGLIMEEINAIAQKKSISFPDNIIGKTFQKSNLFPYSTPTSLQLDVQSNKANNELELVAGAIMENAEKMNIPVPETKKIYIEIKKMLAAR